LYLTAFTAFPSTPSRDICHEGRKNLVEFTQWRKVFARLRWRLPKSKSVEERGMPRLLLLIFVAKKQPDR
jgi:hypothetical protein